jgi:hypothetical protein
MPINKRYYYIIDRDETEFGGDIEQIGRYENWGEARAAWRAMEPDPAKDVTLWLGKVSRTNPDDCDTLAAKPEEAHPFSLAALEKYNPEVLKKIKKTAHISIPLGGPARNKRKAKRS